MKIRILVPSVISVLVLMVIGLALLAAYEARHKVRTGQSDQLPVAQKHG